MPVDSRPSRAAVRRRRAALLAVLAAVLVAGAVVGASHDERSPGASGPAARATAAAPRTALERARADVARTSLRRQVGQLLIVAFPGAKAPEYVVRALREGRAAGVILFGANAPSAESVRALTASLRRAARAGGQPPPIVCLDQEGGAIRTLRFAPSAVGQAAQPTPEAARAAAAASARELRRLGVNVVLGPVADVAGGTTGSVMAGRAYPGDAAAAAASTRAAVAAYLRGGVLPVVKHFPGLGGATTNTDDAPARIDRTRAELTDGLRPFSAAFDAGAPLVMLGHASYPALDPERIASQSHAVATGLLHDTLGFDGVTMTDSLEAQASLDSTRGDVGAAALRALTAGADLLLMTGAGSFPLVRDAVMSAAHRSPAVRARIAEAAARVQALRREWRRGSP
ncbi:MAG TPA: glycoside hydrolase family 3 N-terminal domain-containing protein [Conexibacter sp.]|nr:glycoside hydrolase family 3 N-terminal domain-containing protein [Conexibacter sp.]